MAKIFYLKMKLYVKTEYEENVGIIYITLHLFFKGNSEIATKARK